MASHLAISGIMNALVDRLRHRLPASLADPPVDARVQLFGSADFESTPVGTTLSLFVHRLTIDPTLRNRFLPAPPGEARPPQRELPLDVHFLAVSFAGTPDRELELHAFAMRELADAPQLGWAELASVDSAWRREETVQVTPEELATEDLLRIWENLSSSYRLSTAYCIRGVQVGLEPDPGFGRVRTRVLGFEPGVDEDAVSEVRP